MQFKFKYNEKEYILNEKLDVSIDFDNNEEVSNILVINHAK